MHSIQINSVIISKEGLMQGRATGRTRKCCVDCKAHSRSCQVVWEGAGIGWVCMATLMPRSIYLAPPAYQVVSVQEGMDYLGSHGEDDGGVVTDDRPQATIGEIFGLMFGKAPLSAPNLNKNIEHVEFDQGDRGTDDPTIAKWVDEAQTLVRKDWKA